MTTSRSAIFLPVILSAFSSAASATTAVPCWSSWNTGMSSTFLQRFLDIERVRRSDVFQVDCTKRRSQPLDGLDDFVGARHVETDRKRIDAAELLEQQRLAFHHRHRRFRADVAQTQHRRAVGDDGDRVLANRVVVGQPWVGGDCFADPSYTRACTPSTGRRCRRPGTMTESRSCHPRACGTSGRTSC